MNGKVMSKLFEIKNKWVCITGGTGYLGSAMALYLNKLGAKVIVISSNQQRFDDKLGERKDIYHIKKDLSTKEDLAREVSKLSPSVDVLINNAHYGQGGDPKCLDNESWDKGIDGTVNLYYRTIRDLVPLMHEGGSVINIASVYGMIVPDFSLYPATTAINPPNYGAGKAAIIHLTKYLSLLFAPKRIRVNCISPGAFCRPVSEGGMKDSFRKKIKSKIPLKRIGTPQDLSGAVLFLASEASSYMTGQNLVIDGGLTNQN